MRRISVNPRILDSFAIDPQFLTLLLSSTLLFRCNFGQDIGHRWTSEWRDNDREWNHTEKLKSLKLQNEKYSLDWIYLRWIICGELFEVNCLRWIAGGELALWWIIQPDFNFSDDLFAVNCSCGELFAVNCLRWTVFFVLWGAKSIQQDPFTLF